MMRSVISAATSRPGLFGWGMALLDDGEADPSRFFTPSLRAFFPLSARRSRDLRRIAAQFRERVRPARKNSRRRGVRRRPGIQKRAPRQAASSPRRSEEHTSELQSLMRISYAVFCLKKKKKKQTK